MNAATEVALNLARGTQTQPLCAVLAGLLDRQPQFAWCEPRPTRTRQPGCQGLWSAPCAGLRAVLRGGLELEEARLFWDDGAIHLLARGAACAWSAFWTAPDRPAWLAPLPVADNQRLVGLFEGKEDVLTQRDWNRYGLPQPAQEFPRELQLITYRRGTTLVFWHLRERRSPDERPSA